MINALLNNNNAQQWINGCHRNLNKNAELNISTPLNNIFKTKKLQHLSVTKCV